MLQLNLSVAEIQHLNYESYYYPCPHVQKRIHAVYFKSFGMSNKAIGVLTGLNRETVGLWVSVYLESGFEALCQIDYGTNKSELETHSESILSSFTERPPMSSNEAKSRIEELTGISLSPSQIRVFMKRNKLRYIKTGHIPAKADTIKQQQPSTTPPASMPQQSFPFLKNSGCIMVINLWKSFCTMRVTNTASSWKKPQNQ